MDRPRKEIAGRRWWIAGLAVVLVGVLVYGAFRTVTNPDYIEKKLSAAIAADGAVNRVRIGSSNFNPWSGTFTASQVEFVPDTVLFARRKAEVGRISATRYTAMLPSVRIDGIRLWPLLRGRIIAASASVDSARVLVALDRTDGPSPRSEPARLPHDFFQSIERPIRIDTFRVRNAYVSYSETAIDGNKPGTIEFSDLWADIKNVTNDSTRMTPSTPCTAEVRARIADVGRLQAQFGYDLRAPKLSMTYRGSVTGGSAQSLNDLLVNLAGIRIKSGAIDSTWFDFQVQNDVARGKVQILYHDLDFEMLDKETQDRGLMDRIKTFIGNKKTLNDANPGDDDEAAKVIAVNRRRSPEMKLPRFLWQTLKEGIFTTVGIWKEPPTATEQAVQDKQAAKEERAEKTD